MARNVAEVSVETLVLAGVKWGYGLVGDSLNGITEAIRENDPIEWIPVRHEESAAFAAGAEAHLTGSVAVCAGSCGPGNLRVERSDQLRPAIERALARDGPALVDVVVNRQELPMPPKIGAGQAMGFGLYLLKAVLNGRGDDVVDLVKTNLRR